MINVMIGIAAGDRALKNHWVIRCDYCNRRKGKIELTLIYPTGKLENVWREDLSRTTDYSIRPTQEELNEKYFCCDSCEKEYKELYK